MNTPSHILLHLTVKKYFQEKITIPKSFIWGGFAPDIWLYLCVFFYTGYSQFYLWNSSKQTFHHMFDTLYFEHPFWIFSYNILHSPMVLGIFLLITKIFKNFLGMSYRLVVWFFLWCALHSLLDIPLHHDDWPRIFYPLNDFIVRSPISYWDTNHYANYIIPIELFFVFIMFGYVFLVPFLRKIIWKK